MKSLNRFLCNNVIVFLFGDIRVSHLDLYSSDCRQICLRLNKQVLTIRRGRNHKKFKFEEMWLLDERYKNIVEECWTSTCENYFDQGPHFGLHYSLNVCENRLVECGQNRWKEMLEESDKYCNLVQPRSNFQEINTTDSKLNKALEEKKIQW